MQDRQASGDSDSSQKSQMYWFEALDSPPSQSLLVQRLESKVNEQAAERRNMRDSAEDEEEQIKQEEVCAEEPEDEDSLEQLPIEPPKLDLDFDNSTFDPFGVGSELEAQCARADGVEQDAMFSRQDGVLTTAESPFNFSSPRSQQTNPPVQADAKGELTGHLRNPSPPQSRIRKADNLADNTANDAATDRTNHPRPSLSEASSRTSAFSTLPQDHSTPRAGNSTEASSVTPVAGVLGDLGADPFTSPASHVLEVGENGRRDEGALSRAQSYRNHPLARGFVFPSKPVAISEQDEGTGSGGPATSSGDPGSEIEPAPRESLRHSEHSEMRS
jgi:hypothetical protein